MDWIEEGRIERLCYIPKKKEQPVCTEKSYVSPEFGMEFDYHGREGDSMLLFFSQEARLELEKKEEKGLCFSKFSEHITVSGLELDRLNAGDILQAGEAEFRVLLEQKKCHPKDCGLQEKQNCLLKKNCIFVEILHSGEIFLGQRINVKRKR